MKLYNVLQSVFNGLEGPRQLIVHEHARRFAVLDLHGHGPTFGLSWRSDMIEPIVEESENGRVAWLGIDQRLVAVGSKDERLYVSLGLNSNLLQLVVKDKFVVALTETEAILFNQDYSIRFIKGLPDLPDSLVVEGQTVAIRLVSGQTVKFDSETGRTG